MEKIATLQRDDFNNLKVFLDEHKEEALAL